MMNDIRLTAYDEWWSRVCFVPFGSCYPQNQFFCVGKIVDYKRWEVRCFSGKFLPAAGRRSPDKTVGFVLRRANFVCPPKRPASPTGGAPQLTVTADLPAGRN